MQKQKQICILGEFQIPIFYLDYCMNSLKKQFQIQILSQIETAPFSYPHHSCFYQISVLIIIYFLYNWKIPPINYPKMPCCFEEILI